MSAVSWYQICSEPWRCLKISKSEDAINLIPLDNVSVCLLFNFLLSLFSWLLNKSNIDIWTLFIILGIEDIAPPNNCPSEYRLIQGKCFFISNSTNGPIIETYINSITECVIKGGKLYEPRDAVTYLTLVDYLEVKWL